MNGEIWTLKEKCNKKSFPKYRKALRWLYNTYLDDKSCFIGRTAKFKTIPIFPHRLHGIFISANAEFGSGCVIFHHVTVGSNTLNDSSGNGSPIIGDNCYIGAGAKIIGNVIVGNNVRIGANCVVVKDVPDYAVVVLQPSRVILKEQTNKNEYLVNRI